MMLNKLMKLFTSTQKQAPTLSIQGAGSSFYPNSSQASLQEIAFETNEVAYAAVNEIVQSAFEAPMRIKDADTDELIKEYDLLELLRKPNLHQTDLQFWEQVGVYMYLAGEAFIYKQREGSKVVALWTLSPENVDVMAAQPEDRKTGYQIGGYKYRTSNAKIVIAREDMIHIKFASARSDQVRGFSPFVPAMREIAIDNALTDYTNNLIMNNATPSGVLESNAEITDESFMSRLKSMWQSMYSGSGAGKVAVLTGGLTYKPISFDFKQLAFDQLRSMTTDRILVVTGVPPILLGLKDPTYSNYEVALRVFYEKTVSRFQKRFVDAFENDVDFNPDNKIRIFFDTSELPAFRNVRAEEETRSLLAYEKGAITLNELRRVMNYEDLPEGDQLRQEPAPFAAFNAPPPTEKKAPEPFKKEATKDRHEQLTEVLGRGATAAKFENDIARLVKRLYKRWGQQLATLPSLEKSFTTKDALTPDDIQNVEQQLDKLANNWTIELDNDARSELGAVIAESGQAAFDKAKKNSRTAAAQLGLSFNLSNEESLKFINSYRYKFANGVVKSKIKQVRKLMNSAFEDNLTVQQLKRELKNTFAGQLADTDALRIARTETIRAVNAGAEQAYRQAGYTHKEWVAAGDACPYCTELDGKIVRIGEPFVEKGANFTPKGADGEPVAPLNMDYTDGELPNCPAHPGCRCGIVGDLQD